MSYRYGNNSCLSSARQAVKSLDRLGVELGKLTIYGLFGQR